ncbi:serine hydrolase domain-containing protein [Sphingosinicella rhizophila]|uniref:Serine hydrolase domain-containing protein n=1 Tax=Sphingosinicella rhizophila TaxID=3050082 RepID=A0ABU3QBR5_9SPHN|nr:serine hydrolase domain-containing protein [Sphingosinicella sp. GR2756]MDT9600846.1 serine hydrolase domain-containing protein [Sphingosinicella sp. GR2756]
MTTDFAALLGDAARDDEITGASFAYWGGQRLETAVAGLRNSVTRDPVTPDTLMHIGSITKLFNTVLLMQLVDDGLISLDDPVVRHLPDLKLGDMEALQQITCRMLVNHTSGIDGDMPDDHGPDQERIVDAIDRCSSMGQLHVPGQATSYSNIGTVIAGYLSQRLRGMSWYSLVKRRLFEPLEMTYSLVDVSEAPRFRVSIGDQVDAAGKLVQSGKPFLPLSFAPCGTTAMMTASDLMIFARALLNNGEGPNGRRILSAKAAAQMAQETATFAAPESLRVGLGWMLLPGGVLTHSGGGPGVWSSLYAHPASGRIFVILTNSARLNALKASLIDPILRDWTGLTSTLPSRLPMTADTSRYGGWYENSAFRVEIFSENGRLFGRGALKVDHYETMAGEHPAVELHRIGEDRFEASSLLPGLGTDEIAFVGTDVEGRMQAMSWLARLLVRRGA